MLTFFLKTGVFAHFWPRMQKPGRAFGAYRARRAFFSWQARPGQGLVGLTKMAARRAGLGRASGQPVALSAPLQPSLCSFERRVSITVHEATLLRDPRYLVTARIMQKLKIHSPCDESFYCTPNCFLASRYCNQTIRNPKPSSVKVSRKIIKNKVFIENYSCFVIIGHNTDPSYASDKMILTFLAY